MADVVTASTSLSGGVVGIQPPEVLTYLQSQINGGPGGPSVTTTTFAELPAANAVAAYTAQYLVTDVGIGGSVWYSDGTRWRAVGGRVTLRDLQSQVVGVAQAGGQNLAECAIPAGLVRDGDIIRVSNAVGKSGTSDSVIRAIRVSASSGATAGVALVGGSSFPGTTNRSAGEKVEFRRVSSTQLRPIGNGSGVSPFAGNNATALQSPVTVVNMDSATFYIANTITMTSGTETPTQDTFVVELLTCGA